VNKNNLQHERELIYLLLHNKETVDRFYDLGLLENYFQEDHTFIVSLILECYDSDGILLTRKTFKEKLKSYKIPKDRIAQELAFNACYAAVANPDDLPMLASKVVEQNVKFSFSKALEGAKNNISSKGDLAAIKILAEDCENILSGVSSPLEKRYFDDIRKLSESQVQYLEDVRSGKIKEEPLILSGIREMDYTMVTGFEKGTLTLICADVGGFKSAMMLNIGLNIWRSGFDVLFVPLEMTKEQMWRRACAREAKVKTELITRDIKNLTDDQMEKIRDMNEMWDKRKNLFFMMEEPSNTTVVKIQRQIEKHIDIIKPKIVIIDYIANLEAHKNRYGRNDLEIGDMLKSMRQMGKDMGFAVLSAAQLGREALKRIRKIGTNKDKVSINSEDLRGSHEYSADADNIFAQLKSTTQPNQLLDIFCVKSRNGPTVFESGYVRATLDILPEFGLISSPPLCGVEGTSDENDEDEEYTYTDDFGKMLDKVESDEVENENQMFKEDDDMYDDFYSGSSVNDSSDDCDDVEKSIKEEPAAEKMSEWNDDF
jgi:replicative DNA helicase